MLLEILPIDQVAGWIEAYGDQVLEPFFRAEEQAYCRAHRKAAQHWAARLAAKRAVQRLSASHGGRPPLKTIEITRTEAGAPGVRVHGEATPGQWWISLSHDGGLAAALVVRG